MWILILFLIAGSSLAYISKDNLTQVSVYLGPYVFSDVPVFYVIMGALLTGLIVSSFVHFFHDLSMAWLLRGKRHEIKQTKNEVAELTKRVHQLELENEKLKHTAQHQPTDRNAL